MTCRPDMTDHPVSVGGRKLHVMGDDHESMSGGPRVVEDGGQLFLQPVVETQRGLAEDEYHGIQGQRARDSDTLLLSAPTV